MIGIKSMDYNTCYTLLKGNYRKGVHRLRTILKNPDLADEFSKNLGCVAVVLGTAIGYEDKNSEALRELLYASDVLDEAVVTWMSQWYPESSGSADELFGDADRCRAIREDALFWRTLQQDMTATGKAVVTLVGGDCAEFADISAVVSDAEMMALVVENTDALRWFIANTEALAILAASEVGMTAVANSETAIDYFKTSSSAMPAFCASTTAMNAICQSAVAMPILAANSTAMGYIVASSTAIGRVLSYGNSIYYIYTNATAYAKWSGTELSMTATNSSTSTLANMGAACKVLGLDPDDYNGIAAFAADSNAVTLMLENDVAMNIMGDTKQSRQYIMQSETARDILMGSSEAMLKLAKKATWLNGVALVADARQKWMESGFAHDHYDTIYNTLHNANARYFTKTETYYESAGTTSATSSSFTEAHTATTGFSSGAAGTAGTFDAAVSYATIVLLNQYGTSNSSYTAYYGSSQTKEVLVSSKSTTLADGKKVCVGGLCYRSSRSGYYTGYRNLTYAVYAAK